MATPKTIEQIATNYKNNLPVVFAGIGDSIMWGSNAYAPAGEMNWPADINDPAWPTSINLFRANLKSKNPNSNVYNYAIGGWTTQNHINSNTVQTIINLGNVDVVMIALGVNDSWSGSGMTTSTYRANLQTMVTQLKTAGIQVVLIKQNAIYGKWSVYSSQPSSHAYNLKINFFPEIDTVALNNNLAIIDEWTVFNDRFEAGSYHLLMGHTDASIISLYGVDNDLHPNSNGHALIKDAYVNFLESMATFTFTVSLPRHFNAPFNSVALTYSNIAQKIYSDANCTVEDSTLGQLTTGQTNIIDKWLWNESDIPIAVQLYDSAETLGIITYSWDGITYADPTAWHLLSPGEKHNFKAKVDLTTTSTAELFFIGKRVRG